jgi:hypothetical protein
MSCPCQAIFCGMQLFAQYFAQGFFINALAVGQKIFQAHFDKGMPGSKFI